MITQCLDHRIDTRFGKHIVIHRIPGTVSICRQTDHFRIVFFICLDNSGHDRHCLVTQNSAVEREIDIHRFGHHHWRGFGHAFRWGDIGLNDGKCLIESRTAIVDIFLLDVFFKFLHPAIEPNLRTPGRLWRLVTTAGVECCHHIGTCNADFRQAIFRQITVCQRLWTCILSHCRHFRAVGEVTCIHPVRLFIFCLGKIGITLMKGCVECRTFIGHPANARNVHIGAGTKKCRSGNSEKQFSSHWSSLLVWMTTIMIPIPIILFSGCATNRFIRLDGKRPCDRRKMPVRIWRCKSLSITRSEK